jgi:betaine-aldehyde dehydrogenase
MINDLPDHATLELGGKRQGDTGYFYEATIVSGLRQSDVPVQNEIFRAGHHGAEVHRRR